MVHELTRTLITTIGKNLVEGGVLPQITAARHGIPPDVFTAWLNSKTPSQLEEELQQTVLRGRGRAAELIAYSLFHHARSNPKIGMYVFDMIAGGPEEVALPDDLRRRAAEAKVELAELQVKLLRVKISAIESGDGDTSDLIEFFTEAGVQAQARRERVLKLVSGETEG